MRMTKTQQRGIRATTSIADRLRDHAEAAKKKAAQISYPRRRPAKKLAGSGRQFTTYLKHLPTAFPPGRRLVPGRRRTGNRPIPAAARRLAGRPPERGFRPHMRLG